jgi:hypothetical protein
MNRGSSADRPASSLTAHNVAKLFHGWANPCGAGAIQARIDSCDVVGVW